MARVDDEGLTWDGDDDPTLVTSPDGASARRKVEPAQRATDDANADGDLAVDGATAVSGDLPAGWNVVGNPGPARATADELETDASEADTRTVASHRDETSAAPEGEAPGVGNAALIGLGVIGGAYLLYSIGWLIAGLRLLEGLRLGEVTDPLVSPVAFQITLWLTVLAAPIWFGVVLYLTRRSKAWIRFVLLIAGVAILVPWPFIMVGAIG